MAKKIDYQQAEKAVKALKEYISRNTENDLLGSDHGVWIDLTVAKMPVDKTHRRHTIALPHSILPEDASICLIVQDRPQNYQEKLEQLKLDRKTTVYSAKQFRETFARFEARRQIARQFGLFLVDACLAPKINSLFGKSFTSMNKHPMIVNVSANNKMLKDDDQLKQNIQTAINYTTSLESATDRKSVKFGLTKLSEKQLVENFKVVVEDMIKDLVWEHILQISIRADRTPSLPIYNCVPGVWLLSESDRKAAINDNEKEILKTAAKAVTKKSKPTKKAAEDATAVQTKSKITKPTKTKTTPKKKSIKA
ncbi:ribosomal protein L1p/L10e family-domain-containing protein [Halteromyces radiatus]|uniref:ribosomal protein L1p/L10e family-domain-containing protein n=1 Tax=Halteromyces radiatus TaxID=101107 RepID=UPI002220AF19|nr:ribosomal protein L1p/L10e family-domain-containing protein [Halteromyces radiatus]KAI8078656.1 ribosomal protein L1p/L10e family-domain-containing protein [Halteromyces radiatus]